MNSENRKLAVLTLTGPAFESNLGEDVVEFTVDVAMPPETYRVHAKADWDPIKSLRARYAGKAKQRKLFRA